MLSSTSNGENGQVKFSGEKSNIKCLKRFLYIYFFLKSRKKVVVEDFLKLDPVHWVTFKNGA